MSIVRYLGCGGGSLRGGVVTLVSIMDYGRYLPRRIDSRLDGLRSPRLVKYQKVLPEAELITICKFLEWKSINKGCYFINIRRSRGLSLVSLTFGPAWWLYSTTDLPDRNAKRILNPTPFSRSSCFHKRFRATTKPLEPFPPIYLLPLKPRVSLSKAPQYQNLSPFPRLSTSYSSPEYHLPPIYPHHYNTTIIYFNYYSYSLLYFIRSNPFYSRFSILCHYIDFSPY